MITEAEFDSRINALRQNDFLADMKKYMFRTELTQTHNVGISGGTSTNRYNLAVNYTSTKGSFINTHSNRVIIDLNNEWKPQISDRGYRHEHLLFRVTMRPTPDGRCTPTIISTYVPTRGSMVCRQSR